MAFQTVWYNIALTEDAINLIENEIKESTISDSSWVGGFLWTYIERANRENFLYDISGFDNNSLKYKVYNEGDYQSWSIDRKPIKNDDEKICKLSFILQLSDVNDYEGGNVQFVDEDRSKYFIPRPRSTITIFDSHSEYRVLQVTKGTRKSLVGCVLGPQWK